LSLDFHPKPFGQVFVIWTPWTLVLILRRIILMCAQCETLRSSNSSRSFIREPWRSGQASACCKCSLRPLHRWRHGYPTARCGTTCPRIGTLCSPERGERSHRAIACRCYSCGSRACSCLCVPKRISSGFAIAILIAVQRTKRALSSGLSLGLLRSLNRRRWWWCRSPSSRLGALTWRKAQSQATTKATEWRWAEPWARWAATTHARTTRALAAVKFSLNS